MKKSLTSLLVAIIPLSCFACPPQRPALDKVQFQLSAKQWVSTQTALLTVSVNATLTNADLVKARADIMSQLNNIASGEWHITQFDRSQDSSGLDKLTVEAQLRVLQSNLTDVYKHAKSISKPGITYTINGIEFKPDLADTQQAKNQLRENLYKLVADEMTRINKAYGEQHYTLNRLTFVDGDAPVQPMPMGANTRSMKTMALAATPAYSPIAVSNELTMTVIAQAASNRVGGDGVASCKP